MPRKKQHFPMFRTITNRRFYNRSGNARTSSPRRTMKDRSSIAVTLLFLFLINTFWFTPVSSTDSTFSTGETFTESLTVRPLTSELIDLRFTFRATSGVIDELFPRSISQLVSNDSNIKSFGLTLTRGVWRFDEWGLPPIENSSFPYWGTPGVTLEAYVSSSTTNKAEKDSAWTRFVRSLAGMTCVSFEQVALEESVSLLNSDPNEKHLLALIPSETACTENLSNFVKLFPCRAQAGLGKLIKTTTILRSSFYSMSVFVKKNSLGRVELEVFVRAVVRNTKTLRHTLRGGNEEEANATTDRLISRCPTSPLRVFSINGAALLGHTNPQDGIDVLDYQSLIPSTEKKTFEVVKWISSVRGGDVWGSLSVSLRNHHPTKSILIDQILDVIPFYLHVRFDSIRAMDENGVYKPIQWKVLRNRPRSPISLLLQNVLLPANSSLTISYDFDKAFLAYDEYPPNPNRGFDVPGALVELSLDDGKKIKMSSNAALVSLPLPDFSMPYNVVTLTCTAFALVLGSFVNVVTRKRGKDVTEA